MQVVGSWRRWCALCCCDEGTTGLRRCMYKIALLLCRSDSTTEGCRTEMQNLILQQWRDTLGRDLEMVGVPVAVETKGPPDNAV